MNSVNRNKEFFRFSSLLNNLLEIIDSMKEELQIYRNNLEEDINLTDINKSLRFLNEVEFEIMNSLENLKELMNPFLLFVIGNGNYGKSTLINALLEDSLIKTKDLPNTWKLDLFCKSKEMKEIVEFSYINKEKEVMSLENGEKLLLEEEKKFKESKKKIFNYLKEYKIDNNLEVKALEKYKKNLEKKYLYISEIVEAKYYLNKNGILDDFIIVDTPGLNQNLDKSLIASIKDYYIKSDGIIWIIDAQNIVSKNSCDLINDINKLNRLTDLKKKMVLVVNKIDIIEKNNPYNLDKIKLKVKEIYSNVFDDIVFISAKDAINGISENKEELVCRSNIRILKKSINTYFKRTAEINQINSKRKNLSLKSEKILKNIDRYKRELYKDISIYNTLKLEDSEKINKTKFYIIDLIKSIKNKSCYKDINMEILVQNLKEIELICNKEIKIIYQELSRKSNFIKGDKFNKYIDYNIYITKNKNIVIDYNLLKSIKSKEKNNLSEETILNSIIRNKSKKFTQNDEIILNTIYKKIDTLIEESVHEVNEKFELMKINIENIRENTFEYKYLNYKNIKNHIKDLDMIYNMIRNLR